MDAEVNEREHMLVLLDRHNGEISTARLPTKEPNTTGVKVDLKQLVTKCGGKKCQRMYAPHAIGWRDSHQRKIVVANTESYSIVEIDVFTGQVTHEIRLHTKNKSKLCAGLVPGAREGGHRPATPHHEASASGAVVSQASHRKRGGHKPTDGGHQAKNKWQEASH